MKKLLSLIVCVLLLTGCNVSNSNKDVKLYCDEGNLVNGRCQIIETMQPIKGTNKQRPLCHNFTKMLKPRNLCAIDTK